MRSSEPIIDRGEAGFTLIELLVTLAVLAISITAIGALMATNNRGTLALDQRLAMVEATRAVVAGLPGRSQLRTGTLSGEYNYHRWQLDMQPLVADFVDPRKPSPWMPEFIVVRMKAPGGQQLRIETVRLRNAQAAQR
ncbi:MAG: prepilin-type N-terminal cleavage/methylation domain-containing protein [Xanthobacteraceae bacterium]|nr:prepilin-type N-terminal cleavage/methylation domain-containing protein [Xanthobacteraceae bacterium]